MFGWLVPQHLLDLLDKAIDDYIAQKKAVCLRFGRFLGRSRSTEMACQIDQGCQNKQKC